MDTLRIVQSSPVGAKEDKTATYLNPMVDPERCEESTSTERQLTKSGNAHEIRKARHESFTSTHYFFRFLSIAHQIEI